MSWITISSAHGKQAQDELEMGIQAEMEHADTIKWLAKKLGPGSGYSEEVLNDLVKEVAVKIAQDHLRENGAYYSRLSKLNL